MLFTDKKYELDLIENSIDSFRFGIDAYIRGEENIRYYKLAIKEIFCSYELILKDLLARKGEFLIFKKSDKVNDGDGKTIEFDDILKLLSKECIINIKGRTEFSKPLEELRKLRNRVQHYKVSIKKEDVASLIARTIPLMAYILEKHYYTNLKDILNEEQHKGLLSIEKCYAELLRDGESVYKKLSTGIKYKGLRNHKPSCSICGSSFLICEDIFVRCLCCHNSIELIEFAEFYIQELLSRDSRLQRFDCSRCWGDYLLYSKLDKRFQCVHCGNIEDAIELPNGKIIPPMELEFYKNEIAVDEKIR